MEKLGTGNYSGNIKIMSREAGLIATVTQYVRDDFNGNEHYHSNPHISFTIDGGFVEKKKESIELMPGSITYYFSGEKHQVTKIAQTGIRVNLEIEQSFMDKYSVLESDMQRAFTGSPDAKFFFVKISHELLQNDKFTVPSIQMLFLHHIQKPKNASGPNHVPGWIRIVKEYLGEHWDEGLDLLKVAAAADVHPVTVSKYFPKYFGCSLGEYLRKLKVEKALCFIKKDNFTLTRTAYESGFFDQSHFIRSFKKFNGLLPSAYKKLGR